MNNFTKLLTENSEKDYVDFEKKLIPSTKYEFLGVRVPKIKELAKKYSKNKEGIFAFLSEKHKYYEEFFLHGLLLEFVSDDVNEKIKYIEDFLPHIDNWAICDSTVAFLKCVKKNKTLFFEKIKGWINSPLPYTVRFSLALLLDYYCEDEYFNRVIDLISKINSEEYYVNMALAWLYSVFLIKNYDKTVKLFEKKQFSKFIQNKSIQKAVESFRISDDKKEYLKKLKI